MAEGAPHSLAPSLPLQLAHSRYARHLLPPIRYKYLHTCPTALPHRSYRKDSTGLVTVEGTVWKEGGHAGWDAAVNLPVGFRPTTRIMTNQMCGDSSKRGDVYSDGRIAWMNTSKIDAFGFWRCVLCIPCCEILCRDTPCVFL